MGFDAALRFTLGEEGGYVDDARDRGGATNRGVTQATYDAWRESQGVRAQDVRLIPESEVRELYRQRYWDAGHCETLPTRLGVAHFDWCVNRGTPGATKTLQQALGVDADGCYGSKTVAALGAAILK
jgi:lysozyme family protein